MLDRLVELCREAQAKYLEEEPPVGDFGAYLADHLLANGVIVPPYKCGTAVYVLRSQTSNGENLYMHEERIEQYRASNTGTFMTFESGRVSVRNDEWSRCVFATLEEAEQVLKGGHHV